MLAGVSRRPQPKGRGAKPFLVRKGPYLGLRFNICPRCLLC